MSLPRLIVIIALLCTPAALDAQIESDSTAPRRRQVERSEYAERFHRTVAPAVLGSGVGMVAGALVGAGPFYNATGCCGDGDSPGLTSGFIGAFAGATLGATMGAYLTHSSDHPVSMSRAFVGATLGIGTGLLVGVAGAHLDDFRGLTVGFAIGQGGTVAAFAMPYP